jgi:hypothetical protein
MTPAPAAAGGNTRSVVWGNKHFNILTYEHFNKKSVILNNVILSIIKGLFQNFLSDGFWLRFISIGLLDLSFSQRRESMQSFFEYWIRLTYS